MYQILLKNKNLRLSLGCFCHIWSLTLVTLFNRHAHYLVRRQSLRNYTIPQHDYRAAAGY